MCGVFARFVDVSGTKTFSSDSQFNLGCTANSKKLRKFTATPTTRSCLVSFAARWTDDLHKALVFKVKNDIAKLLVQST